MLSLGLEHEDYDVPGCTLRVIFEVYFDVGVPRLDEFEDLHVYQVVVYKEQRYVVAHDYFAATAIHAQDVRECVSEIFDTRGHVCWYDVF
jgi:hypothetical protein